MRFAFCLATALLTLGPAMAQPIFPNSVVSNDIDFIRKTDPSAFTCIAYLGTDRREMPSQSRDELFADNVRVYSARFTDGTEVGIWVHPEAHRHHDANRLAQQLSGPLGHLPTVMRRTLSHVVVNEGDDTAFGEDRGRFFVLSAGNMALRLRNNDLEETVFHEAVHATLDIPHANARGWKQAQRQDGAFVTDYAASRPDKEDLAESALFAFAILMTPGRLPDGVATRVRQIMPARLAYLEGVFGSADARFQRVGPARDCS